MPATMENDCLSNILNLTMQFGGLSAKAQDKDNPAWDQERIDQMYERLMDTASTCRMAERCMPPVRELHNGLNALMDLDTVDTSKRDDQLRNVTRPLMQYISCLFANYEISHEVNLDGIFLDEDFPDMPWVQTIYPKRVVKS